jgi:hypothetical protein
MKKGFKKPLELDDLGNLPRSDSAAFNYRRLQKFWTEEVNKKGLENASIGKTLFRTAKTRSITGAMLFLLALITSFVGPVRKEIHKLMGSKLKYFWRCTQLTRYPAGSGF